MFSYDQALKHSRALDWKKDQQRLEARLEEKRRHDAEKAAEKAAEKDAKEARFLALGMKHEAHVKSPGVYPELTPEEFAEAADLLGVSGPMGKRGEDAGLRWMANAAAHLDMLAFTTAIENSRSVLATTTAAANPRESIVDAVFEAHALRMGL